MISDSEGGHIIIRPYGPPELWFDRLGQEFTLANGISG
jgi:hypothetical protein